MSSVAEPFVVGANHTIKGTIYDNVDGVLTALSLTGATVKIRAELNGTALAEWTATPDADQTANKGKFTYKLASADLQKVGALRLQAWVTVGADTFKSKIVDREVIQSLAIAA